MVGKIVTYGHDNKSLSSGSVVVLKQTTAGSESLDIVTLQHLDANNDWIVMGTNINGKVDSDNELCRLFIESNGTLYPLKFNQWYKAIKNNEVNNNKHIVEFDLIPVKKFKPGTHIRKCTLCYCSFTGSSQQQQCKRCNNQNRVAKIKTKVNIKPKRPRITATGRTFPTIDLRALAIKAYEMGKDGKTAKQFFTWLDKHL